jgi:hypothetical protein
VAAIAEQLGTPFMPWQRLVADVAMELDPTTGLLAYREIDLTTPRQSGKTTLELAVLVHRCRTWARSRVLYSAQDRIHARLKWEDDHVATLDRSPFAGEYRVRYQRGDEAIRWHNGSRHGIAATASPPRVRRPATLTCSTWPWPTRRGGWKIAGSNRG